MAILDIDNTNTGDGTSISGKWMRLNLYFHILIAKNWQKTGILALFLRFLSIFLAKYNEYQM